MCTMKKKEKDTADILETMTKRNLDMVVATDTPGKQAVAPKAWVEWKMHNGGLSWIPEKGKDTYHVKAPGWGQAPSEVALMSKHMKLDELD